MICMVRFRFFVLLLFQIFVHPPKSRIILPFRAARTRWAAEASGGAADASGAFVVCLLLRLLFL
jgi:hypothetical protein